MTRAAITIDVDSLRFYREIHGLPPADVDDPIYTVALPRFFELLDQTGVKATLFVIGADAERHRNAFLPIRKLGCEIASHSYEHDYRLTQRSAEEIDRDLARAEQALATITSDRIEGFRAPGYNVSPELLERVVARGYTYDSSLLPAPGYWALRALAIGRYAIGRRPSRSLIGEPRAFAGPLEPYRTTPARPWRKVDRGALVEVPMTCEPTTRIPLIGTLWPVLPEGLRTLVLDRAFRKLTCINFEMHAIDLLDRSDAVPSDLAAAQADLRIAAARKVASFRALFSRLRAHAEVDTLSGMVKALDFRSRIV